MTIEPPSRLPGRDRRGHKGTFGTVCIVGGCSAELGGPVMIGGPALAALASLRTGAGLARLAMPVDLLAAALTIAPSATGVPITHLASVEADAFVIGPGLGRARGIASQIRGPLAGEAPVVLDADALNLIADDPGSLEVDAPAILTPHIGEFRRLAGALGVASPDPAEDPAGAARALAGSTGRVVVLKSSVTAVADGERAWIHDDPNPVLATAGTGDVLAGILGGLIAQFGDHRAGEVAETRSLFELACLGVCIHARAARAWSDRAQADAGMLAGELLDHVPGAVNALRG